MFKIKFLGKIRVSHQKTTASVPAVRMTPPTEILLPVEQHIGAAAIPVVKVGDEVKVGQLVAEAPSMFSSPIHASVSGKVTKIDAYLTSSGKTIPAIRIQSDGLMTPCENITPPEITDIDSLVCAVHNSGIVGLGGAGFPTALKLAAAKDGKIHTVIINAAECEGYLTTDTRTMIDDADFVKEGVELMKRVMPDVKNYYIGIESNKPECIENMKNVFEGDESVSVKVLPSRYPQGAEKVIIHNIAGITVPAGKLPKDVGVIVINVTTVAKIAEYVKTGMPLVERRITVDGSAVKEPKNLFVPIGAPIREVVEFAGGLTDDVGKVLRGGPMMGTAVYSLDEPILKTTGGVVALNKKASVHLEDTACIHCGRCVEACSNFLNPTAFTKALDIANEDERMARLDELGIMFCVECGSCSYVCPAKRPLIENNKVAKNSFRRYTAAKKDLK